MSNVYEAFGEEETVVLTDLLREYLGKFWLLKSDAHAGLEFEKNKGKASLALNVTKFFRASRPVYRASRPV